jgi:hypothetical protein
MSRFDNDGYYGKSLSEPGNMPAGCNPAGLISRITNPSTFPDKGFVGETKTEKRTYPNRLTVVSATHQNVIPNGLTLDAGIWDLGACFEFLNNNATVATTCAFLGISKEASLVTDTGTLNDQISVPTSGEIQIVLTPNKLNAGNMIMSYIIPQYQVICTQDTTFYPYIWITLSNSLQVFGSIYATRRV